MRKSIVLKLTLAAAMLAACGMPDNSGKTTTTNTNTSNSGSYSGSFSSSESGGPSMGSPGQEPNGPKRPATCANGAKGETESDVDCGGSTCSPCVNGRACGASSDCNSGLCKGGVCTQIAPTCSNKTVDNAETARVDGDTECGGNECRACPNHKTCRVSSDCDSGLCHQNRCTKPPSACYNSAIDGTETDRVDSTTECGGNVCRACPNGKICKLGRDCDSGLCKSGVCAQPPQMCFNKLIDGSETDRLNDTTECGGDSCRSCPNGKICRFARDCDSGQCNAGRCGPPPPTSCRNNDPCAEGYGCYNGVCQLGNFICSEGEYSMPMNHGGLAARSYDIRGNQVASVTTPPAGNVVTPMADGVCAVTVLNQSGTGTITPDLVFGTWPEGGSSHGPRMKRSGCPRLKGHPDNQVAFAAGGAFDLACAVTPPGPFPQPVLAPL